VQSGLNATTSGASPTGESYRRQPMIVPAVIEI
jgi:hypothetical protein